MTMPQAEGIWQLEVDRRLESQLTHRSERGTVRREKKKTLFVLVHGDFHQLPARRRPRICYAYAMSLYFLMAELMLCYVAT